MCIHCAPPWVLDEVGCGASVCAHYVTVRAQVPVDARTRTGAEFDGYGSKLGDEVWDGGGEEGMGHCCLWEGRSGGGLFMRGNFDFPILAPSPMSLTNIARPPTDATLTVRIIKSLRFRTEKKSRSPQGRSHFHHRRPAQIRRYSR